MSTKEKSDLSSYFEPLSVGSQTFNNRVFMAPMTRNRADHTKGTPSGLNALYYTQRASAGLIISEATQISQEGKGYAWTPGIHNEEQVSGWRTVTEAVHNAGGKIFCQLWHVGAISHPVFQPNEEPPVSASPFKPEGKAFVGDHHPDGPQVEHVQARELKKSEIPRLLEDYKKAAECAKKAGFDGVEIHCANGYLIDQFIRDSVNKRSDEYGGEAKNRVRLMSEVVDAVLQVWSGEQVGVRLSPIGGLGGSYDSNPKETYTIAAQALSKKGLLYLHVVRPNSHTAEGSEDGNEIVKSMKKAFGGCLIVNGEMSPEEGHKWLQSGEADAVSFGRLFLANPDLPERIQEGGPFNEAKEDDFYGGGPKGYIDYPSLKKIEPPYKEKTTELSQSL